MFDQSLYSKQSRDDSTNLQTFTNYKQSIVNSPVAGVAHGTLSDGVAEDPEVGAHTPAILPAGSLVIPPGEEGMRSSSPARVFAA